MTRLRVPQIYEVLPLSVGTMRPRTVFKLLNLVPSLRVCSVSLKALKRKQNESSGSFFLLSKFSSDRRF
jgi:hypothetical protein